MRLAAPDAETIERLTEVVGPANALSEPAAMARYLTEPRGLFHGASALVLRPGRTEEVAAIMRIASEARTGVVPQGGGTGLVGGQVPGEHGGEVVVSLERMNRIRAMSASGNSMIVEAGATLAAAQAAADEADRLFPLSLASEGSCQIGGNLATNAGGTAVLAYGNARDLVLGLEVVLADGRVWNGLKTLRKDNTGYDLKHLFVGSEGTLGIITAAALKLFPKPRARATALAAIPDPDASVALLARLQAASGGQVTTFELMPRIGIDFVLRHGPGMKDPMAAPARWYVLAELSSGYEAGNLSETLEYGLTAAHRDGLVLDAVLAASEAQAAEIWRFRELISDMQKPEGGSIKNDISVPVEDVPAFIARASKAVTDLVPGARPVAFGHVGDGNIHFNVSQPVGADRAAFLDRWGEISEAVNTVVAELGGSVSAEHGIGRLKREVLARVADPVGLDLMKTLKRTLDPGGILNPGKLLDMAPDGR